MRLKMLKEEGKKLFGKHYRSDFSMWKFIHIWFFALILITCHKTFVNAKRKDIANAINSLRYLCLTYFGSKLNLSLHYPFLAVGSCRL